MELRKCRSINPSLANPLVRESDENTFLPSVMQKQGQEVRDADIRLYPDSRHVIRKPSLDVLLDQAGLSNEFFAVGIVEKHIT